ncbi:hypothetical protein K466DRAFT_489643 [Polyporus arcularius HHB13444]|uniref:Late embryogenesis abundant protein LEA-2 subgroup domain-containing protein n=1 Tax=Polyporus arcularius HHB13444 TaxID=1314778 RepID=A0A5C3PGX8_9APHY|nr:hypothetical protein K466DRAFT_489643 [Polyporus arcularius HHB13444]
MAYHDPYTSGQYPQPQYQDAPFNPYEVQQQQARGYDQGGLGGGYGYSDQDPSGRTKERTGSTFEDEDIVPPPIGDKTPGNIRRWRKDYQGKMWTKGSRASCFGRFFCCTIMVFLFFLISIVLSLALWLRPPNIIIGQPTPDLSTFSVNGTSFSIALPVDISLCCSSVNNPNYFTVILSSLDASVIYPINNTQVGSGHMADIKFKDHTQTNFTFPVTIEYDAADDPTGAVITDLATKCGVNPNVPATQVSVTVKIKVGLNIMLIPISTTINQSVNFGCNLGSSLSELEV